MLECAGPENPITIKDLLYLLSDSHLFCNLALLLKSLDLKLVYHQRHFTVLVAVRQKSFWHSTD